MCTTYVEHKVNIKFPFTILLIVGLSETFQPIYYDWLVRPGIHEPPPGMVGSIFSHAEFGSNDHQKDAPHFSPSAPIWNPDNVSYKIFQFWRRQKSWNTSISTWSDRMFSIRKYKYSRCIHQGGTDSTNRKESQIKRLLYNIIIMIHYWWLIDYE